MTYVPIPAGTLDWDAPVNAAFVDQDERITDNTADIATNTANLTTLTNRVNNADAGLFDPLTASWIAWNFDPAVTQGSSTLTSGQLVMVRLDLPISATINNLIYAVNAAGSGLTAGQNLIGLYNSAGTLLAGSVDQSGNWTSTGLKVTALSSPQAVGAGTYYLGFLSNGTTPIGILRGMGSTAQTATINANMPVATARFTTSGAGLTALPASVTMSGRALFGGAVWVSAN